MAFEDLLAARVVLQQQPAWRTVLEQRLRDPRGGPLLEALVREGWLPAREAEGIRLQVARTQWERELIHFVRALQAAGVPHPEVARLGRALGEQATPPALGEALRRAGLLAAEQDAQLRRQAAAACQAEGEAHWRAFLGEAPPAAPAPAPAPAPVPPRAPLPERKASGALPRQPAPAAPQEEAPLPAGVRSDDPRVGEVLAGFRLLGRVGAGGMGTVYLARREADPAERVALKLLARDASSEAQGRFKREILAQSFFDHPGVLDVFDAGQAETGEHFLAMEFFPGADLGSILEAEGHLPPTQALDLAGQVLGALQAAHQAGVIHRDVKPQNVLVSPDRATARLMDFGIALLQGLGEFEAQVFRSLDGQVTGTPEFMSPQQAAGEPLSPASDLYSMGCLLYLMLAGRLPFQAETSRGYQTCHLIEDPLPLAEAAPHTRELPAALGELLARLLAKEPEERPADCAEVIAALEAIRPTLGRSRRRSTFWGRLGLGGRGGD